MSTIQKAKEIVDSTTLGFKKDIGDSSYSQERYPKNKERLEELISRSRKVQVALGHALVYMVGPVGAKVENMKFNQGVSWVFGFALDFGWEF